MSDIDHVDLEQLVYDLTNALGKAVVSVAEAARVSGLGDRAVTEAIRSGELALLQRSPKGNRSILVRDLAAWMLDHRHFKEQTHP